MQDEKPKLDVEHRAARFLNVTMMTVIAGLAVSYALWEFGRGLFAMHGIYLTLTADQQRDVDRLLMSGAFLLLPLAWLANWLKRSPVSRWSA
jgi:hypothetical protein